MTRVVRPTRLAADAFSVGMVNLRRLDGTETQSVESADVLKYTDTGEWEVVPWTAPVATVREYEGNGLVWLKNHETGETQNAQPAEVEKYVARGFEVVAA